MGEAEQKSPPFGPWPLVADDEDVYRLLNKPRWISLDGQVTTAAFQLRPNDHGCLSLGLRGTRSEEQFCLEEPRKRNECAGVAHAKANAMQVSIPDWPPPLYIIQDEEWHSCLTGLPEPVDSILTAEGQEAKRYVEYVGNELAKRVTVIWRKPKS